MKVNKKKKGISTSMATNLLILTVAIFTIGYMVAVGILLNKTNQRGKNEKLSQICFTEKCFDIEVADTPEKQAKGLMFRESLEEDVGMLFVFDRPSIHHFWMKNTLISLDMLWIDKNNKVINIVRDIPPCPKELGAQNNCPSYGKNDVITYVLELNAGITQKYHIYTGDIVEIITKED